MKEITLTKGKVALVDDEDFEHLSGRKWTTLKAPGTFYAYRKDSNRKSILMHREIIDPPRGMQTDHKDRDGLNNQRNNLRICTQAQNNANTRHLGRRNTTGFRGVFYFEERNKWVARISIKNKPHHLGIFTDKESAALAYDNAARKHFGEFASLNYS